MHDSSLIHTLAWACQESAKSQAETLERALSPLLKNLYTNQDLFLSNLTELYVLILEWDTNTGQKKGKTMSITISVISSISFISLQGIETCSARKIKNIHIRTRVSYLWSSSFKLRLNQGN